MLIDSVTSPVIEVQLEEDFHLPTESVFIHGHLLRERSEAFGKLIDRKAGDKGHLVIGLEIRARPFERFARWIYGQPMWVPNDCVDFDEGEGTILDDLVAIHDFSFDARKNSGTWDIECMNASLEAIKQFLSQTTETLHDPISCIESVLKEHG
jgi:hypothetical protein